MHQDKEALPDVVLYVAYTVKEVALLITVERYLWKTFFDRIS
jgi:hypothetical protein